MVEISLSGSGEGPGWATVPGYSTTAARERRTLDASGKTTEVHVLGDQSADTCLRSFLVGMSSFGPCYRRGVALLIVEVK